MTDKLIMKNREDIKRTEGLVVGMTFILIAMVLVLLSFMFPEEADAWPGKGSCAGTSCHGALYDTDARVYTAIDGTEYTPVTWGDPITVTKAANDTFEIDYYWTNATQATAYTSGIHIVVPIGWTVASGTAASAPSIGNFSIWSSVWDATDGVTNGWAIEGVIDTSGEFAGTEGYTIDFDGTPWDIGNRNTACDDGVNPCVDNNGADLDLMIDTMGADALITVPGGTSPGTYPIYVMGVGHEGGTKSHVRQLIDVTISSGPNTPPTLTVNQPDGVSDTVTQGAAYSINYDLADAEEVVTVAFYYDIDNIGLDGTAITGACAAAAEGTGATCSWDTTGVTPGTYYVYGIADDGVDPAVNDYSSGQITIDPPVNNAPILTVNQPDGVSDNVTQGNPFTIDYDLADVEEVVTVAFYFDTDAVGLDGTPISGACATAPEGTGVTCSWDTTGVTLGSYYIYGITDDGVNPQVDAYSSGQVTISAGNTAPVLSISLPNGDTVAEGASFSITYTMTDPDDIATVGFYYDTNNVGADGTAITECATLAEGTGVTCSWNTTGEAGTWYVYGIADDGVNSPVTSPSRGTLTVNNQQTLTVNQPDGVSDTVVVTDSYNIDYDLADSDDVVTVAFYYDVDADMAGGTAITGACATAAEGTGATCSWDTTGVTPGSYYVYGTTDDGASTISNVSSGQITIQDEQNPNNPAGNDQYYTDDVLIKTGWTVRDTSIRIKATVSDNNTGQQVELEVDIQDNGVGYDNTADCTSGLVANGSIATATCSGLVNGTTYKWQVRTSDENNNKSSWVDYGAGLTVKTAMDIGVDAGPNTPPSLTLNQPNGNDVPQVGSFNINYDLSDPDNAATAVFYYDVDTDMAGGTAVGDCASEPEGTGVNCAWTTNAVTPGIYYVYGIADDGVNPTVSALSPGTIKINDAPTLSISQPDGVGDSIPQGNAFDITYTLNDTDDVVSAAFYYDTDAVGFDGSAIAGACGTAIEGSNVICAWDTSSVTPGNYYVYGITNDTVNSPVQVYSGQITVTANSAPTILVTQPDGTGDTVTAGDPYNITYDLSDTDDIVTAAFYYDIDAVGLNGTPISGACATASEGTGVTCNWDTTGMTPGSYYVYGVTNDGINPQADDYSPGQITINPANNPPTLSISQPDGIGDSAVAGDPYNITYTLSDAEDAATVAFYYDTDNSGQDGSAIPSPCDAAPEGTDATCAWDTTGVPAGIYYVYGIADDGVNTPVVVYSSGTIEIGGELVINPEFNTIANWTINLDTGTVNATCTYDAATDHTGDASGSVKGHEEGQDNTFRCTITQDISSIVTKDATISTASVWTLFSSNFEAAGDSVTIDLTTPATSPVDTDTNVTLDSDVTINFSEDVACGTVTNANITMTPAPATSWSVFSCTNNQVVMRPVGQVNNTSYTVDVTLNVTDLAGNTGTPFSFSYTTEP